MTTMVSQITSLTVVYSTVYSDAHQSKTSKLRVTGLCVVNSPGPVNSPHKGSVTRKMFLFDDVIMSIDRADCVHVPTCMVSSEYIVTLIHSHAPSPFSYRLISRIINHAPHGMMSITNHAKSADYQLTQINLPVYNTHLPVNISAITFESWPTFMCVSDCIPHILMH